MDFIQNNGNSFVDLIGGIGQTLTQVGQSVTAVNNIFHPQQPALVPVAPGVLPSANRGSSSSLIVLALAAFFVLR